MQRKNMTTDAPRGLSPLQMLPLHMIHFTSDRLKDSSLYEIGKWLLVLQCLEKWHGQFHTTYLEMLPSGDCGSAEVTNK